MGVFMRILTALVGSVLAASAAAEKIGRHGDDPPVDPQSPFVRKLWADPVPVDISRLFYLRAVLGIAGDHEGLARLESFIQHAALLKLAGRPRPDGATIEEAVRKSIGGDDRELREQVLDRSLAAALHKPAAGETAVSPKHLRVDFLNTSSMSIKGFSALLSVRARGSEHWIYAWCRDAARLVPGERSTTDCEATLGPRIVHPGDAAFEALMRDTAAHWRRGTAEATVTPRAIAFTEGVHPRSVFTITRLPAGPGTDAVDLKESMDARAMAVGQLRLASCEERDTCVRESIDRVVNAHPFVVAMLVGFAGGLVPGLGAAVLFRRHAVVVAAILSAGVIGAGTAATVWAAQQGSQAIFFAPLLWVALFAAVVGLWIGVAILKTLRRTSPA